MRILRVAEIDGGLDLNIKEEIAAGRNLLDLPMGQALGKMRSPPLLRTSSSGGPVHRSLLFPARFSGGHCRAVSPCRRVFSMIAPTLPLLGSLISKTREVERYECNTLPTIRRR